MAMADKGKKDTNSIDRTIKEVSISSKTRSRDDRVISTAC